jgi:hypothetical protein
VKITLLDTLRLALPTTVVVLAACTKPIPPQEPVVVAPVASMPAGDAASAGMASSSPMAAGDAPTADDLTVTTRVKTAFQGDSMLKAQDIQITTTKGDVRLTGQVQKAEQKDRANELARTLPGVHSIHDELTLKP